MDLLSFVTGFNLGSSQQCSCCRPEPVPMSDAQAAFFVCVFIASVVLLAWVFWHDWMDHRRIANQRAEKEAKYRRRYAEWQQHRVGMPPCPPSCEYVSF